MSRQSVHRLFQTGCVFGVLLGATLACITPWEATGAERRAVEQLEAALKTLDHAPAGAVLLAEEYDSTGFTGIEREYVGAGVRRVYGINWTCEEIVADYEAAMLAVGWKQRTNAGCDYPQWSSFYLESGEVFSIYAEPFEGANVEVDKSVAQQFQTTYLVNFHVRVPIE